MKSQYNYIGVSSILKKKMSHEMMLLILMAFNSMQKINRTETKWNEVINIS